MTENGISDLEMMKKYLLGELSAHAADALEERIFEDENFFAEVLNVENELVDDYVQKRLNLREQTSFEKNYLVTPEKRQKVANAETLRLHLENLRTAATNQKAATAFSFAAWLRETFAVRNSWQLASAALVLLICVGTGSFIFNNLQKNQEIANLGRTNEQIAQQNSDSAERERQLQIEIENAKRREVELQQQLNAQPKNQNNAPVAVELNQNEINSMSEKVRQESEVLRRKLEQKQRELEELKRQNRDSKIPVPPALQPETIASITLKPQPNGMDTTTSSAAPLNFKRSPETTKIAVDLILPRAANDEKLIVELDGAPLAAEVKPSVDANGVKKLRVTVDAKKLSLAEHSLTIKTANGNRVGNYVFQVQE